MTDERQPPPPPTDVPTVHEHGPWLPVEMADDNRRLLVMCEGCAQLRWSLVPQVLPQA